MKPLFFHKVAGVPTNINFLLKLANHYAFERGDVETHFIEQYKDDLFVDPSNLVMAKEAYEAAGLNARLAAACLISLELSKLNEKSYGIASSLSTFVILIAVETILKLKILYLSRDWYTFNLVLSSSI